MIMIMITVTITIIIIIIIINISIIIIVEIKVQVIHTQLSGVAVDCCCSTRQKTPVNNRCRIFIIECSEIF